MPEVRLGPLDTGKKLGSLGRSFVGRLRLGVGVGQRQREVWKISWLDSGSG